MRRGVVGIFVFAVATAVSAAEPPVATVGGRAISRADLEAHVKAKLIEIENERYEALRDGLDEMIADELIRQEAKARGMTVEALVQTEIESKVTAPSDAQVQQVYEENKEQLNNAPLDSVKPRIVEYLKQQQGMERQSAFLQELRRKYKTVVTLQPPVVEVGTGGRPERGGGANAPVTIISFSDYECPFCKRAESTVQQVLSTYGDKIRFVHRDFPLSIHAHALPAAEAANCANAQGKFWPYHDKLFASQDLGTEKLQALATEVGLDRAKFDECLAKEQFKPAIDKDIADGGSVGVTGTPAFFINGRALSGAQPFEKFKEVIDEELERAKPAKPS
jgi:protein-disulfide isomerase